MNPTFSPIQLWTLAALTLAGSFSAPAQETNRAKSKDFTAFKIITERNIFDPSRRPVRPNSAYQPRTVDSFFLAGTISYSNMLLAVFDGTKPDYHKALKTSEPIAGYTVAEINYDSVKLSAGTNQLELKVGMQLRRSEDGKWSVSESSGSYESSYASNLSRRNSDRRDSSSDRSQGRNSSRGDSRPSAESGNQSDTNNPPDMAGGPPPDMPPGGDNAVTPPLDAGGSDPNDVVARLMRARRDQQLGGNQSGASSGSDNGNNNNNSNQ